MIIKTTSWLVITGPWYTKTIWISNRRDHLHKMD